jgi:Tfp pilus assembly protein FimT
MEMQDKIRNPIALRTAMASDSIFGKNITEISRLALIADNQHGWTIVETVVTMVIIVVTAMFAAPEVLSWRQNMKVAGAARELYADIQGARVKAIEKNYRVVMTFDTAAETYLIFVDNGGTTGTANNGICEGDEEKFANKDVKTLYEADIVSVNFGAGTIGFSSQGLPLNGNSGNIVVKNSKSTSWYKIEVKNSGAVALLKSKDGTNGSWK